MKKLLLYIGVVIISMHGTMHAGWLAQVQQAIFGSFKRAGMYIVTHRKTTTAVSLLGVGVLGYSLYKKWKSQPYDFKGADSDLSLQNRQAESRALKEGLALAQLVESQRKDSDSQDREFGAPLTRQNAFKSKKGKTGKKSVVPCAHENKKNATRCNNEENKDKEDKKQQKVESISFPSFFCTQLAQKRKELVKEAQRQGKDELQAFNQLQDSIQYDYWDTQGLPLKRKIQSFLWSMEFSAASLCLARAKGSDLKSTKEYKLFWAECVRLHQVYKKYKRLLPS